MLKKQNLFQKLSAQGESQPGTAKLDDKVSKKDQFRQKLLQSNSNILILLNMT